MKAKVLKLVTDYSFGGKLIDNSFRGVVAEGVVKLALSPEWHWTSEGWAPFDFKHNDGTQLEVKQSAAQQTWSAPAGGSSRRSFDIRARNGYQDGSVYTKRQGRNAAIYVFAFHPREDDGADHLEPTQWEFYVLPETELPAQQKTISLSVLKKLVCPVSFEILSAKIETIRLAVNAASLAHPIS